MGTIFVIFMLVVTGFILSFLILAINHLVAVSIMGDVSGTVASETCLLFNWHEPNDVIETIMFNGKHYQGSKCKYCGKTIVKYGNGNWKHLEGRF